VWHRLLTAFGLLVAANAACPQVTPAEPLGEITVTATWRETALRDVPASVTVLDRGALTDAGEQHFQDVLGLVPNLNWAGGSSRPRFFQLRGVGDLEQYQGAPNPSIGFLIDDIDLSGVGMAATLFDVEQVEVLRGPQGTRYGANALGGLIKLKTRAPRREASSSTQSAYDDTQSRLFGDSGQSANPPSLRWRVRISPMVRSATASAFGGSESPKSLASSRSGTSGKSRLESCSVHAYG